MGSARIYKDGLALLEAERRALATGDLDQLEAIADRKSRLLDALSDCPLNGAELAKLRQLSSENARFIAAARQGVEDVIAHLAQTRDVQSGLKVYHREGTIARHPGTAKALSIRR